MGTKDVTVVARNKKDALKDISDRFGVVDTVKALQKMMTEVTKDKITPETVNAACNCVQNLNLTIKTSIQAARFLASESKHEDHYED